MKPNNPPESPFRKGGYLKLWRSLNESARRSIPFPQGMPQTGDRIYARMADAPGGSVYEGVSSTPKEVFFLRNVQES
jgi:hypothetical protein